MKYQEIYFNYGDFIEFISDKNVILLPQIFEIILIYYEDFSTNEKSQVYNHHNAFGCYQENLQNSLKYYIINYSTVCNEIELDELVKRYGG